MYVRACVIMLASRILILMLTLARRVYSCLPAHMGVENLKQPLQRVLDGAPGNRQARRMCARRDGAAVARLRCVFARAWQLDEAAFLLD